MKSKRAMVLLICSVVLGAGFIVYDNLVDPALVRLKNSKRELDKVVKELAKIQTEITTEKALRDNLLGIRIEVSKRDGQMVQKKLVDMFQKIGRPEPRMEMLPEARMKSDYFSERPFKIEGETSLESAARSLFELAYYADYFRVRRPTLTGAGLGFAKIQFSLTGSALMAVQKAGAGKADPAGLKLPDRPGLDKFREIWVKNIFSPHASLLKGEEKPVIRTTEIKPPPQAKRFDVRLTSIAITDDGKVIAAIEATSRPLAWVRKGDKYGKYYITDIVKGASDGELEAKDQVVMVRGKEEKILKLGEVVGLLSDEEKDP